MDMATGDTDWNGTLAHLIQHFVDCRSQLLFIHYASPRLPACRHCERGSPFCRGQCGSRHRLQVTRSVEWEGASVRAVFSSVTATSGAGEGAWTRAGSRPSPGLAITFCATSPCCRSASSARSSPPAWTEGHITGDLHHHPAGTVGLFQGEQRDGGRFSP
ncbi:Uncharacterised protein [Klebsiella pneumoniae]|nr:Uncharacterised protein [Klebsiella pneumoniae]